MKSNIDQAEYPWGLAERQEGGAGRIPGRSLGAPIGYGDAVEARRGELDHARGCGKRGRAQFAASPHQDLSGRQP